MTAEVTVAACTDIGRVRRLNQDAYAVDAERRVYIVCDGMGGAAGGEVASAIAVESFLTHFRKEKFEPGGDGAKDALFHAATAANDAIFQRAEKQPALYGMGSTLVAAHIDDNRLLLVNVGDSRAYLVRDGQCSQLTVDHSFLGEQVRAGLMSQEAADASALQSVITRAVGIDPEVHPDLFGVALEAGDCVLLTTDGLTRHVMETEIAQLIGEDTSLQLETRCGNLVKLANERGGSDNITCVLLEVGPRASAMLPPDEELLAA